MSRQAFQQDVSEHDGYAYTGDSLSGTMSNARISRAIHKHLDVRGKSVLDIGCGDGTYSAAFAEQGASAVLGIDPVENAIKRASERYRNLSNLRFQQVDFYAMQPEKPYDIAVLRGVLHHMPDMPKAIEIACRLAKTIAVMEPNGYNPVLKIIEKTSTYHIEHQEQSFMPLRLRREFAKHGARLLHGEYVGLVPFFCPPWMARFLKFFEPLVERIPLARQVACGQYIMHVDTRR